MKNLKLIIVVMVLFLASVAQSQVSVSVNIGVPPPWGPVGYSGIRYYYLPDVEAYYDVHTSMYIYLDGGLWVNRGYLPHRYRNYDLYGGYKVVMSDYHGNTPYTHYNEHRHKYAKGYHGQQQRTIGQKPGRGNSNVNKSPQGNRNNNGVRNDKGKNVGGGNNNKGNSKGNNKNDKGGGNNKRK